ncbi:hypothetical protein BST36_11545 [Mycolicibacterium moriokaense]|jgi:hypothetical protein|uniref:Transmembrane protein n=1 Tax=Mycolicibacterium moriokaense TaxID=39691 RepID=A0AAD1H784_9MYCO|nr:hypothetical protein [Mycolicibacterium moriokaense]MCV7037568.1 hypothetical protein [Mycolicibacterium moriokaense]ORB23626.1 hypothetical protein BST36_11545 [Mycolicibacterium moriokaense]BBW99494.1 hypothetical protein MMOR_04310 [Mycolicibacterium moriokaense]
MFIVAVLCWCAAAALTGLGVRLLLRRRPEDPAQSVLRGVAPTQLAAAAMLAAAGTVALSSRPDTALVVVVVCVIGAVSTVAAGCWQAAKVLAGTQGTESPSEAEACGGTCATCTLSCS